MGDEIPWLEEWCSVNIKAARADDFGLAHRLATGAAAAAAAKGILLGPAAWREDTRRWKTICLNS